MRASQAPNPSRARKLAKIEGSRFRIESALIALELGKECLDAFATRRRSRRLTRCFTVERGNGLVGPSLVVFAYHPIQVLAHFRPRRESFLLRVSRQKLQAARAHTAFRQRRHNVFDRPLGAGSIPRLSAQRVLPRQKHTTHGRAPRIQLDHDRQLWTFGTWDLGQWAWSFGHLVDAGIVDNAP